MNTLSNRFVDYASRLGLFNRLLGRTLLRCTSNDTRTTYLSFVGFSALFFVLWLMLTLLLMQRNPGFPRYAAVSAKLLTYSLRFDQDHSKGYLAVTFIDYFPRILM